MWRRTTKDAAYTEWEGQEAASEEHRRQLSGTEQSLERSEGRTRNGTQETNGFTARRYVSDTAKTKKPGQKA